MSYGNRSAHNPNRGMGEVALVVKSQCSFTCDGKTYRPGDEVDPGSEAAKRFMHKLFWPKREYKDFVDDVKAKSAAEKASE